MIFKIQKGFLQGLILTKDSIPSYLGKEWESYSRVLEINSFTVKTGEKFDCFITIQDKWGIGELELKINEKTNAGMGNFELTKK